MLATEYDNLHNEDKNVKFPLVNEENFSLWALASKLIIANNKSFTQTYFLWFHTTGTAY